MFEQRLPKYIEVRCNLPPSKRAVIRRFGLPVVFRNRDSYGSSKRLCALIVAAVVLMLAVQPSCCASNAPAKAGFKPGHYEGSRKAEPVSGEKDFLASLESSRSTEEQEKEAPVYVTLLRFGLSLALVLGLAYLTILGLKKSTLLRTPLGSGHGRMRLVENLSLGAGRALHLVEVGSKKMVLASTANSVSLLTEVSPEDLPEPPPFDAPKGFKEQLIAFLGSGTNSDQSAANVARVLRESTAHVWDGVNRLGSIRRRLRDA